MKGHKTVTEQTGYEWEKADIELCCDEAQEEWNLSIGYNDLEKKFVMWRTCSKKALGNHLEVGISFCPHCGAPCVVIS